MVVVLVLPKDIMCAHAAADSTKLSLLCHHFGLEVWTGFGGMEAIWRC